jgi:hypothetical protein
VFLDLRRTGFKRNDHLYACPLSALHLFLRLLLLIVIIMPCLFALCLLISQLMPSLVCIRWALPCSRDPAYICRVEPVAGFLLADSHSDSLTGGSQFHSLRSFTFSTRAGPSAHEARNARDTC